MKKTLLVGISIILLSFIIGIYFYPQLPENMDSHWNIEGQADGYLPKFWGVFFMPFLIAGLFLLFVAIPKIDPLKINIEKFRKYYDGFIVLIIAFFFYLHLLIILWNLGVNFSLMQLLTPAIGLIIYSSGILVENVKKNWFAGIRTPWTMSSDVVWKKTHKLGGKLFKIAGMISLLGILFENYLSILFILIPILLVVIYLIVYSYVEYQKLQATINP